MIIYGTRTMTSTRGEGTFNCPRCGMGKPYRHQSSDRYFTLYFIPLIPFGSAGTYIECGACGETYDETVLNHNPEAERAHLFANLRYALEVVLLTAGRTDAQSVTSLRKWYESAANAPMTDQQIGEEIRMAQQAGVRIETFVPAKLGDLTMEGKYLVLRTARDLLGALAAFNERDLQVLRQLGAVLQLPPANVNAELGLG